MVNLHYPYTRTIDQVDDYHGTLVADHYRWLENTESAETKDWIKAQNLLTQSYLKDLPIREVIRKRLTSLWDYPRAFAPRKIGNRFFQLRNLGLQNQDVLYTMDLLNGEKRILLDSNTLSEDGTIALTNWEVSNDGNLLAFATNASGSDWQVWRVRDVNSGKDLPDLIEWSKFTNVAWLPDSSGLYYSRYDQPEKGETYEGINQNQKVYLHRLGKIQAEDILVYQRPDQPEWGFDSLISDDAKYLILKVWKGTDTRNRLFYRCLESSEDFIELIPELAATYEYLGNDEQTYYLFTNHEAPNGKIIAINIDNPEKSLWRTIIPEGEDALENVKLINNQFVGIYLHHAYHKIKRYDIVGNFLGEINLPTIGSVLSLDLENYLFGKREDDEFFFVFHSFTYPPTALRYSFEGDQLIELDTPKIDFDFDQYQTSQVFVKSKDGTQVPMFLVHRTDLEKNNLNPTLLYGYGGFNISLTPSFMVHRLVWLEMGGIIAVANLRGGGEYGEKWHASGSLSNKQNVFDDMIACAEYLITSGYTSTRALAIEGRSNGGLLVGACITQRPDLFGAALPAVGVMDMLRFHKFTIGWAWVSDYGSADDPEQFKVLYSYSPLHNIKPGTAYPATLVTTADHDDRVVPGHSFKFISALQAAQSGDAPVLIRIQTKAGHGIGKPTSLLIEEQTDVNSFLAKVLDIRLTTPSDTS